MVQSSLQHRVLLQYNAKTLPEESKKFYQLLQECFANWKVGLGNSFPKFRQEALKLEARGFLRDVQPCYWLLPQAETIHETLNELDGDFSRTQ